MSIKCSIEELKDSFKEVYDFIKNTNIESLETGRYFLDRDIYLNVDEYNTKPLNECRYEAHKKYIDIQMLVRGNEAIYVENIDSLNPITAYNVDKDIIFYKNNISSNCFDIKEKECLVLFPQDGHIPCVNESKQLNKKVVFKIPYSYTKNIKCLIMDVDGTLTDGKIYMGDNGEVCKAFDIKDGYGIANILKKHDIIPVILTGRESKIVENRAKELGINHVYQGVNNKKEKINEICRELNIDLSNVAYIGDDDNDLPCIEYISENNGLIGCPKNATMNVQNKVNFVSIYDGGNGAVREYIEWICK